MKYILSFFFLPAFFLSIPFSKAQLVINEISSSCNTEIIADDNNDSQDWVEIYNSSAIAIDLTNYFLSDSRLNVSKWQFPSVNLAPGGFILIYCSGENRINGNFVHSNFKIDRSGEQIYITDGSNYIDSLNTGNLQLNHSMGRFPDGSTSDFLFNQPTPGLPNNVIHFSAYATEPVLSFARGFYPGIILLAMSSTSSSVRYTTNGSEPTASSQIYSTQFIISATTVIKARSFGSTDTLPSEIVTSTYFINESGLGNLAVMSISLDPVDFDSIYNHSDYVTGFYPEKISHIEFFGPQHNFQWQTDHDLKLHGTTSTNNPQKGMRSNCRPYYNDPKIQSVLFPDDKPLLTSFTGFNLRQDYQGGGMWDAYATQVSRTLDIDYLALKQVNVFVNGNYWGEYQMREIGDEEYIENNHPYANEDSIDLLRQNYNWSNGFNGITPLAGSDTGFFNALNSLTTQLTPQTPGFRSYFENNFEKNSYFDYMIAENYVGNYDWMGINQGIINNTKLWRPQNGGKWRYILYDCDYSIGIQTPSLDVLNDLLNPVPLCYHGQIFSKLMQDTLYKYYFINRFADMMNTIYQPSTANLIVTAYHDSLLSAMPRHLARWGSSNLGQWESALNTYFIGNSLPRIIALRDQLQFHFSLNQQLNITFEVHPAGAGSVFLNTINPQTYPWSGIYFDGAPISFRAIPNQNYFF